MQRLSLAVVLLLLAPLAFAQIYTWTDAGGTVHYSEAPPESGVPYKQVTLAGNAKPMVSTPVAPATANGGESETPPPAPAAASTPMADTPENRTKLCATLNANLAQLHSSGPLVMKQNGGDVALNDQQRQAQLSAATAQYQQYCQGAQ